MKVFVDSNVIISAILFPKGKVAEVFLHIINNHSLIISDYSINECVEVFKRKFPDEIKHLKSFLTVIQKNGSKYENA